MFSQELEKTGSLVLPNCCEAAENDLIVSS